MSAQTVEWCRDQQRRAADALQQDNPPEWARLALFDAFTEELLLAGELGEESKCG